MRKNGNPGPTENRRDSLVPYKDFDGDQNRRTGKEDDTDLNGCNMLEER